jgi:hypothetical protein
LSDLKLIIERACVKRFDRNQKQRSPAETALRGIAWPCTADCSAAVPFNHFKVAMRAHGTEPKFRNV